MSTIGERDRTALSGEGAELELFSLKKALDRPYHDLSIPKGPMRKTGTIFLSEPLLTGQGVMILN